MVKYDRLDTFFYLDPPYWGTDRYGVEFGRAEYTRMAELTRSIQRRAIISINGVKPTKDTFKGLRLKRATVR